MCGNTSNDNLFLNVYFFLQLQLVHHTDNKSLVLWIKTCHYCLSHHSAKIKQF